MIIETFNVVQSFYFFKTDFKSLDLIKVNCYISIRKNIRTIKWRDLDVKENFIYATICGCFNN